MTIIVLPGRYNKQRFREKYYSSQIPS